jgi:hypothetical protein
MNSKAAAFGSHLAAAATIDEILASEARANLKKGRITLRDDAPKSKPRISVPPARIVARPSQSQAWIKPFISLTIVVGVVTFLCAGSLAYLFVRPLAVSTASDAELRNLRESLAALRRNVAELSSDVAANHTAIETAARTANDRGLRVVPTSDRAERDQPAPAAKADRLADDRSSVARPAPLNDVTGTLQQPPRAASAARDIIAGWHVRRAYDGAAVLEGQAGVIEVVLGQDVPNLGRVQEIKYENGRWQVLTSKGVILPGR